MLTRNKNPLTAEAELNQLYSLQTCIYQCLLCYLGDRIVQQSPRNSNDESTDKVSARRGIPKFQVQNESITLIKVSNEKICTTEQCRPVVVVKASEETVEQPEQRLTRALRGSKKIRSIFRPQYEKV